jgi:hypothetical protein
MKKQILSEEIKRMKQLAGIVINENYTISEGLKDVNGKITFAVSPSLDLDYQIKNYKDVLKYDIEKLKNYNINQITDKKTLGSHFNSKTPSSILSMGFYIEFEEGDSEFSYWDINTPENKKGITYIIGQVTVENNIITEVRINENEIISFLKNSHEFKGETAI